MGQTLHLGAPTVIESAAERTPFAAIFEDDGKVAYFYGLDTRLGDQVLDALHVYNVGTILDHPTADLDVHLPCEVQIVWSEAEDRVALVLNGRPHAAFDFSAKRAYCRSNFPRGSSWSKEGHGWEEQAVAFLNSRA
jgi:hypothetical protein